jgi:branched-chain amino acid aminotransferase group II
MAPALNYGQQAYEGLKAFRRPGDGAITIFRPDRNARRMQHSAEFISCPPVPDELFLSAVKAAVALNAEFVPPHETGAALYVRPQIYGSSAQLGLSPPEEYTFCVFVVPTGVYHGSHPVKALILDEFDRAAPNGTGSAKVGGNYAPVLRWSDKARNEGYGITLHLDSKNHEEVDEFSTSGFIGALVEGDQITIVVPDTKNAIKSVTSESIQEIGRSWGWKVEQRPVSRYNVLDARVRAGAAEGVLTEYADQILGASAVCGGHGGWNCGCSGAHSLHHKAYGRVIATVVGADGQGASATYYQGRRGDDYLHSGFARGCRPSCAQAADAAEGHPARQGRGQVWLVLQGRRGGWEEGGA